MKGMRSLGKGLSKNSNWIFAVAALLGLTGTTWQMISATVKAVKLCEEKQVKGTKEVIRTVWKLYIPGIGFVLLTTIGIAGQTKLNRIISKQLVTATGLYAASQADMKAFKDKAKDMLGEKKASKIQAETDQEKINHLVPPSENDIVKTGHGNQLFQLALNGGYFRASPEWVELQLAQINKELQDNTWNTIYVSRILELFHQPECDIGNLEYNLSDMLEKGYKEIKADISECHWDSHYGNSEIVSVVHIQPWPTGM